MSSGLKANQKLYDTPFGKYVIANNSIRRLFILFGLAAIVISVGHSYQTQATMRDLQEHPAPGKLIEVNGMKYHLNCQGTGSPKVILEAGLGESSLSWYSVHAEIAKTTRTCAYDRLGLGWSDGADFPMSPTHVAASLRALLREAKVESPFILVGHSRGGLFVRNFYHLFPNEVKSMVLVDSVHENGAARELPYARWDYFKQKIQIAIAVPLSQIGFIRLMGWADADRQPSPLPAAILAAKTAVQNRTETAQVVVNEIKEMRKSLEPSTPPPSSLGNVPLVVLTSGKRTNAELAKQEAINAHRSVDNAVAIAQLEAVLQNELATLSSNSKHIIAEKSGHFIIYDQPELVIRSVTDQAKNTRDQLGRINETLLTPKQFNEVSISKP